MMVCGAPVPRVVQVMYVFRALLPVMIPIRAALIPVMKLMMHVLLMNVRQQVL